MRFILSCLFGLVLGINGITIATPLFWIILCFWVLQGSIK